MTERDEGYLQALRDVQDATGKIANGHDLPAELLQVMAFINDRIGAKAQGQGAPQAQDALDPTSGSF